MPDEGHIHQAYIRRGVYDAQVCLPCGGFTVVIRQHQQDLGAALAGG